MMAGNDRPTVWGHAGCWGISGGCRRETGLDVAGIERFIDQLFHPNAALGGESDEDDQLSADVGLDLGFRHLL
jgi:hypothetical protein